MTLPQDVRAWRGAERGRLIGERTRQPIDVRRTVRKRVQAILEAEVQSCNRRSSASIGHSEAHKAGVPLAPSRGHHANVLVVCYVRVNARHGRASLP